MGRWGLDGPRSYGFNCGDGSWRNGVGDDGGRNVDRCCLGWINGCWKRDGGIRDVGCRRNRDGRIGDVG